MQNANLFPKCSLERTEDAVYMIQEFSAIRKCFFILIYFLSFHLSTPTNKGPQTEKTLALRDITRSTGFTFSWFLLVITIHKATCLNIFFPEREGK